MTAATVYLSPYSLWLCVRRQHQPDGSSFVEAATSGIGAHSGPIVFVSRLHACLYAALRNRECASPLQRNWQCVPLHTFDLRQHVRKTGGALNCRMAFGFAADAAAGGALIVSGGAPGLREVGLPFSVPEDMDDVVFNFTEWVFEYIRDEWEAIGAGDLDATFMQVDQLGVHDLRHVAAYALAETIVTMTPQHTPMDGDWTVWHPARRRWIGMASYPCHFGPTLH